MQNIVKNCLEHMDNGGTLRLTGTQTALYCQLVIADDGCGIEKEDLPHIFERFYKGKNAGADSVGIGLALSKSVLNRENATVEVQRHRRRRYHLYHSILSEYYLRALTDGSYGGRILSAPTRALL